jgi:hypothetical protein
MNFLMVHWGDNAGERGKNAELFQQFQKPFKRQDYGEG